jgi:hypothetical protein
MLTVSHFELVAHPQGDICNKYLYIKSKRFQDLRLAYQIDKLQIDQVHK